MPPRTSHHGPSRKLTQGQPVDVVAAAHAADWKKGLADWDQTPERIARLKAAADFNVYTPGSRAGTPLALLGR